MSNEEKRINWLKKQIESSMSTLSTFEYLLSTVKKKRDTIRDRTLMLQKELDQLQQGQLKMDFDLDLDF